MNWLIVVYVKKFRVSLSLHCKRANPCLNKDILYLATVREKLEIDVRPQPDSTLQVDVTSADSLDAPNDRRILRDKQKKFFLRHCARECARPLIPTGTKCACVCTYIHVCVCACNCTPNQSAIISSRLTRLIRWFGSTETTHTTEASKIADQEEGTNITIRGKDSN